VTEPSVQAAAAVLRKHAVRYAIVGGQAIAQNAATTTVDVDIMVTTSDYRDTVARLSQDPTLTLAWEGGPVTRFGLQSFRGVPLDVVDAGVFAGNKSGEEFFEFLIQKESFVKDGIRYVSPEAVWYTRLLTKRWRAYAEKIVTNVIDGLEARRLERVREIARYFGTEATIDERIAYVRDELKRSELNPVVRGG
jgi:hypothetical protein